jgi:RHS repeat-associated protein
MTGNTVSSGGTMAEFFSHRFSTKYWDPETDLYYYGHRFYNPALGRWMSRDPIGERGGIPVTVAFANDAINLIDVLGLLITIDQPDQRSIAQALSRSGGQDIDCINRLMAIWNNHMKSLILGLDKQNGTPLLRDIYGEIKRSQDVQVVFQLAAIGDKGGADNAAFRKGTSKKIAISIDMPIPNACCKYTCEQLEFWNEMGATIAHELGHVYASLWSRGLSQSWWTRFRLSWKTRGWNYPPFASDALDDAYIGLDEARTRFGPHIPDSAVNNDTDLMVPIMRALGYGLWGEHAKGVPAELQPYAGSCPNTKKQ